MNLTLPRTVGCAAAFIWSVPVNNAAASALLASFASRKGQIGVLLTSVRVLYCFPAPWCTLLSAKGPYACHCRYLYPSQTASSDLALPALLSREHACVLMTDVATLTCGGYLHGPLHVILQQT